ncbi:hypothetical protein M9H77_29347 [Catharanthus roseus]|uniref:Uncharacterized protein n=1 Tax=Catharanthus roseus TaxID=4058 RepID=A0ACC0AK63_CATRO|nr:hypothetical protein M9H77_29347 [Catharanthus roseus]
MKIYIYITYYYLLLFWWVRRGVTIGYFSPNHRVTEEENGKETRSTIALFTFLSKMVEVPQELVDDENPLHFKPFVDVDLLNFYATESGRRSQNILKDFECVYVDVFSCIY